MRKSPEHSDAADFFEATPPEIFIDAGDIGASGPADNKKPEDFSGSTMPHSKTYRGAAAKKPKPEERLPYRDD